MKADSLLIHQHIGRRAVRRTDVDIAAARPHAPRHKKGGELGLTKSPPSVAGRANQGGLAEGRITEMRERVLSRRHPLHTGH